MPATMTTNAPVGPPICVRDPPRAEMRKPATTAVYKPACGGTPDAIAKAIASGSATRPDRHAGDEILRELPGRVAAQALDRARTPLL